MTLGLLLFPAAAAAAAEQARGFPCLAAGCLIMKEQVCWDSFILPPNGEYSDIFVFVGQDQSTHSTLVALFGWVDMQGADPVLFLWPWDPKQVTSFLTPFEVLWFSLGSHEKFLDL